VVGEEVEDPVRVHEGDVRKTRTELLHFGTIPLSAAPLPSATRVNVSLHVTALGK